MKVYKLRPDTKYRLMYPESTVYQSDLWDFHGDTLAGKLMNFNAHFEKDSNEPIPDIAYIGMATFAFREDVAEELADILEGTGELLPFSVDGQTWYALNVTTSIDALDDENSTYLINTGAIKLNLVEFIFFKGKLTNATTFKIPQDNHTEIFCCDNQESDDDLLNNLFCAIHGKGYTGISFEEVSEV